jgi:hypothetical protein
VDISDNAEDPTFNAYRRNVRVEHYLQKVIYWAAILLTWHLKSFSVALAAAVAMLGLIFAGNLLLMAITPSFWAVRINRWLWPTLLIAGLCLT